MIEVIMSVQHILCPVSCHSHLSVQTDQGWEHNRKTENLIQNIYFIFHKQCHTSALYYTTAYCNTFAFTLTVTLLALILFMLFFCKVDGGCNADTSYMVKIHFISHFISRSRSRIYLMHSQQTCLFMFMFMFMFIRRSGIIFVFI